MEFSPFPPFNDVVNNDSGEPIVVLFSFFVLFKFLSCFNFFLMFSFFSFFPFLKKSFRLIVHSSWAIGLAGPMWTYDPMIKAEFVTGEILKWLGFPWGNKVKISNINLKVWSHKSHLNSCLRKQLLIME